MKVCVVGLWCYVGGSVVGKWAWWCEVWQWLGVLLGRNVCE